MKNSVIWWVRRDLRLKNNFALKMALETGMPVIPVFIIDPYFEKAKLPPRGRFVYEGLSSLDVDLHKFSSYLIIREGKPLDQLKQLCQETNASVIFAEEDYSPYAQSRDLSISKYLDLHQVNGLTINHPSLIQNKQSQPYTVFTPFKKASHDLPWTPSKDWLPERKLQTPGNIPSIRLDNLVPVSTHFPAGEADAEEKLQSFLLNGIDNYSNDRNLMAVAGTSMLSPYLKTGMISILTLWNAANKTLIRAKSPSQSENIITWQNELIWRDFYQYILYHHPSVASQAFKADFRNIHWNDPGKNFEAWKRGLTGYPIVDAAMRQLTEMNWMHNRARMITASFLTKDLLINWQEGEAWFMENLIDGDLASNNGGWQWAAGVGTDAAPYFRIFNPTIQSKKFDPQAEYIKTWIPELINVPQKYIHEPWLMPDDVQEQMNVRIGRDYPHRIVIHSEVRQRTLNAYKNAKTIINSSYSGL